MIDKHSEIYVLRILDAAANRASEGLRVVEDYARMVIQDAFLSGQLKQLRHDVTQAVALVDPDGRIAARDTLADVGTGLQTESEYERGMDPGYLDAESHEAAGSAFDQIVSANFSRAQQAFRTIEEYAKALNSELAKTIEQVRYRSYTIEKAVRVTLASARTLADARVYVLIDGSDEQQSLIPDLIVAKVGLIQLRDKTLNDRQLVDVGRRIALATRDSPTRFIMNDRADLAVAASADGVHLGQEDLSVTDARRIVGVGRIVGVSTHSLDQARQAVLEGANYIGVGPVFPSRTKHFDSHVGLELLDRVANEVALPSFAIGGINLENVPQVVSSGFTRIAVSASVAHAECPGEAAAALHRALAAGTGPNA